VLSGDLQLRTFDVYLDDGVTGTTPLGQRPEGSRLLAAAKEKAFDTILVYRLDRLGRDPRLNLNTINELEGLGVEIMSMTEPFDSASPTGRFMIANLSSIAGLERETILQRMAEGTNRVVREGAWRGVVPYGYRRVGERRHARLIIADDPIPGFSMSEADVVRLVYRMCVEEGKSCVQIAMHLNRLGILTAYQIDGHSIGKRKLKTAGIWYGGRIRNILVSPVHKGVHYYGVHATKRRELIERAVPAIIDPETWDRAQEQLRKNRLWSPRNGKRSYLLRGMMRCSLCGRGLFGSARYASRRYYLCGGKLTPNSSAIGFFHGKCPSRAVPATIEDVVWADIESFLRNPGPVVQEVAESLDDLKDQVEIHRKDAKAAERALAAKNNERDAVLALYRRGRIDDATVDQQLDEIERERVGLTEALREAQERLRGVEGASAHLRDAEALLRTLNARLDEPLTFALRRELVELLVESIQIDTIPEDGKRKLLATIRYRFSPLESESSFAIQTNRSASRTGRAPSESAGAWYGPLCRCVVWTPPVAEGLPATTLPADQESAGSRLARLTQLLSDPGIAMPLDLAGNHSILKLD